MNGSVESNDDSSPVHRLDEPKDGVQKLDPRLPDMSLEMAKAHLGGAVGLALRRTDSNLKEFGDPSQVRRVCDGEVPTVFARVWARKDTRREWLLDLLEKSGIFEVERKISERRG